MNLNGRIWIGNLILFGIGSIIVIKWLNPTIFLRISGMPDKMIILAAIMIVFLLSVDNMISGMLMNIVKNEIVAQRMLTEQAVIMRDKGMDTEEIIRHIYELRERITVSGMLDTLTYLRKGGRIPSSLAMIGNTLHVKPVIALEECVLKTVGKGVGRKAGKRLLCKRFEKYEPDPVYPIYFAYSSNQSLGEEFMEEMIICEN